MKEKKCGQVSEECVDGHTSPSYAHLTRTASTSCRDVKANLPLREQSFLGLSIGVDAGFECVGLAHRDVVVFAEMDTKDILRDRCIG